MSNAHQVEQAKDKKEEAPEKEFPIAMSAGMLLAALDANDLMTFAFLPGWMKDRGISGACSHFDSAG